MCLWPFGGHLTLIYFLNATKLEQQLVSWRWKGDALIVVGHFFRHFFDINDKIMYVVFFHPGDVKFQGTDNVSRQKKGV